MKLAKLAENPAERVHSPHYWPADAAPREFFRLQRKMRRLLRKTGTPEAEVSAQVPYKRRAVGR